MSVPYIDIHCHPALKPFGKSFKYKPTKQNHLNSGRKNSIWHYSPPNFLERQVNKILTLTKFTQTDCTALAKFNCQIVIIALYPFEKHFLKPRILGFKWIADALVNLAAGVSQARIDYIRNHNSYFQDLEDEYNFYLQLDNEAQQIDGIWYTYRLVNSFSEIQDHIAASTDTRKIISIVPSIEGAHAFETGLNKDQDTANPQQVLQHVQTVKQWTHPPLFVTLAHHFYNEICGHARSINIGMLKDNQNRGLNTGITELGLQVIADLLSNTNGRRIYIDIKHMSIASRQQYYNLLDTTYRNLNIPIIVSHGAVNGKRSLETPNVADGNAHNDFNGSDINFYDSEIVRIARSQGIFGIQLDERRIGSKGAIRRSRIYFPNKKRRLKRKSLLVWRQIQHCAVLINAAGLPCWNTVAIGSDFDGIVNPIKGLWTSENIDDLRPHLIERANEFLAANQMHLLPENRLTAEDIITRIYTQNAVEFLQRYF